MTNSQEYNINVNRWACASVQNRPDARQTRNLHNVDSLRYALIDEKHRNRINERV